MIYLFLLQIANFLVLLLKNDLFVKLSQIFLSFVLLTVATFMDENFLLFNL